MWTVLSLSLAVLLDRYITYTADIRRDVFFTDITKSTRPSYDIWLSVSTGHRTGIAVLGTKADERLRPRCPRGEDQLHDIAVSRAQGFRQRGETASRKL